MRTHIAHRTSSHQLMWGPHGIAWIISPKRVDAVTNVHMRRLPFFLSAWINDIVIESAHGTDGMAVLALDCLVCVPHTTSLRLLNTCSPVMCDIAQFRRHTFNFHCVAFIIIYAFTVHQQNPAAVDSCISFVWRIPNLPPSTFALCLTRAVHGYG